MENQNARVLVLEDCPERIREFRERLVGMSVDFVDTADDCIAKLKECNYNLIFLDHDLGGEVYVSTDNKNTGSEVARWFAANDHGNKDTPVIIHSLNTPAVEYMKGYIPQAVHIPCIWVESVFYATIS